MDLKPKAYVLELDYDKDSICIISGFKTYNETNSIITDLKSFLDYVKRNERFNESDILFTGTKAELMKEETFLISLNKEKLENAIEQLRESTYLLIMKK